MMMNFLRPKNWSKYSRQYDGNSPMLYKLRRVILLSQFTLVGSIIGVLHSLEDLVDGLIFMPAMDFTMAVVIFVCYLLNENGHHKAARHVLLGFLNLFFFVYCSLAERELGIFLYYFAWMGLAAIIFEVNESVTRYFYIILSMVLLVALFATKFDAFGPTQFQAVDIGKSFVINMLTSGIVLIFFIVFMLHMNDSSERRLSAMAEELNEKNEVLEKANHDLDRFLYSTSHDLRSPLMSIKGLIKLSQTETAELITKEYLTYMTKSVDKLDAFIKDIIEYARNSRMEINPEPINFSQMIDETFDNFRFMEGAEKIKFERELSLKSEVISDKGRLTVVLNNLVSNAIKYHKHEDGSWIKVSLKNSNGQAELTIADNGQGISEEKMPKIFDMFYRGTALSKGSGLGLYIVKEAVEKINGSIHAESEFGKGTRFTVKFPCVLELQD